jgi:hypothetical protein
MAATGVTGDYNRLWATISGLKSLSKIPSQVAKAAAPKLAQRARNDASLERDPYGNAFRPHQPATIKRWGPHNILQLTGKGITSISARPLAGAGILLQAADHMVFSQLGTVNERARPIFPNNPTLPKSWQTIIERETESRAQAALKVTK